MVKDLIKHINIIAEIKSKLAESSSKLIYLTISGAHLYGFPSKDSDIDYRGAYVINTNLLLGLIQPSDNIVFEDKDIVLFELKKELELALAGNCNVLEHINAKPILSTTEYINMRQLVNNSFGKDGIYNSYKGMAEYNYKKFILQGRNTVKKYLYVFRGLMAGIYVLQTGTIQPNIEELNRYFKLKEVKQLIELKRKGMEQMYVPMSMETGILETTINTLFEKIDQAYLKCKIPEVPLEEDRRRINRFLKNIRREMVL